MKIPGKENDVYHISIFDVIIQYKNSTNDFKTQILWMMFRVNR